MNASIHPHQTRPQSASEAFIHPDILATGLLVLCSAPHFWFLPQAFHESPFKGILLGAYVFLYLVCALDIMLHSRIFGWFAGAVVCAGSLLAHLVTLTLGWPFALHAGHQQFELISIIGQSMFLLLFVREIALADEED